jgi:hypothetical protein
VEGPGGDGGEMARGDLLEAFAGPELDVRGENAELKTAENESFLRDDSAFAGRSREEDGGWGTEWEEDWEGADGAGFAAHFVGRLGM